MSVDSGLRKSTVNTAIDILDSAERPLILFPEGTVSRTNARLHAVLDVGEAIEVSPDRDRKAEVDPLMLEIETRLQSMLDQLALESPLYQW